MRRTAPVVMLSIFSLLIFPGITVRAADFADGVPPEVVALLAGGTITETLPADFPAFVMPPGVELLGAMDRQQVVQLALGSSLPVAESMEALQQSLVTAGWTPMPAFDAAQPQVGFVAAQATPAPFASMEVCHDEAGIVSIAQSPTAAGVVMTLNRAVSMSAGFSCQLRMQQMQQSGAMRFGATQPAMQFMPRLELPAESASTAGPLNAVFGGGFSSSGGEVETEASTRAEMDLDALLEHFRSQLQDQGWSVEFEQSGAVTAQSNWVREAAGQQWAGMLGIIRMREDSHRLKFTLLPLAGDAAAGPAVRGFAR